LARENGRFHFRSRKPYREYLSGVVESYYSKLRMSADITKNVITLFEIL